MRVDPAPIRPRSILPRLACALLLLGAGMTPASPQEPPAEPPPDTGAPPADDITLLLTGRTRPLIRLAFPAVSEGEGLSRTAAEAAEELEQTLRADLEFSRYFEIQGPWAFGVLELTGEREADFEQYRSLDNEYLLDVDVSRREDRFVVEARLFDLRDHAAVVAKRYRGTAAVARRIAHTLADEIVLSLTGRRGVALTSLAYTSARNGTKEIYLMDYDGANPRPVTGHRSTSLSSSWTPDGSGIAYVSFWSGQPSIYFAALPSGEKSSLVTEGQFNISPSFSPDGEHLAFTRALDGNSEIYVFDRDDGNTRRLTYSAAIDTNPAWSPTGNAIVFTSSRAGNPHLYLMDTEGANLRRLTFDGTYNDGASWSPDGELVAYASRRGGVFQIAVTNVVTLETRLLTSGPGNKEDPTFSPDGRHLAFASDMRGGKQIFVVDVDGRNLERLTSEGRNESPAWSPVSAE